MDKRLSSQAGIPSARAGLPEPPATERQNEAIECKDVMSAARSQGERRRKSRKRPQTLVYVELASANGGMMRDLSAEGFAVPAMMAVRAGAKTPVKFSLNENVKIEGEGIISWVQENGRVAGLRFTEISDSARAQIQEWLIRPEKP